MNEANTATLTGTLDQLSRLALCTSDEMSQSLTELKDTKSAQIRARNGKFFITSKRVQREVNSRTSTAARVAKHRSNAARNAEDTPQKLEVRSQKSEEEKDQLTLQIWTVGKELKIEDSAIGKAIRDFGKQQTKLALEAVMREQPKDPTRS